MSDVAETWEHAGCTIEIVYDMDPTNPRTDWDCYESVMFCDHGRYELGDEDTGIDKADLRDRCGSWQDVRNVLAEEHGAILFLSLYLIDHSGIAMRAGRDFSDCDPGSWDSGQVGWIFHTEKSLREQFALADDAEITDEIKARALEGLEAEVEEYSAYLEGDCVGWVVKNADGDVVDSCWGYLNAYARRDEIRAEANAVAEYEFEDQKKRNGAALMQHSIEEAMV